MATQGGQPGISLGDFQWSTVDEKFGTPARLGDGPDSGPAPLGPLVFFNGTFVGKGFNTVYRPINTVDEPGVTAKNLLLLNLTQEQLAFSGPIGAIPNRGFGSQPGQRINGVSYVQTVSDVSDPDDGTYNPDRAQGIHFEPGVWLYVPASSVSPVEGPSLTRMGSIPHGVTINAQALESDFDPVPQAPDIDQINIIPKLIGTTTQVPQDSLDATNTNTSRIPQDLTKFIDAGTITQDILCDPHTVLRNANADLPIINTLTYTIYSDQSMSTSGKPDPLVGGGTANMSFLEGTGPTTQAGGNVLAPNANAFASKVKATFWIETVKYSLTVEKPESAFADGSIFPTILVAPEPPSSNPQAVVPKYVVQASATAVSSLPKTFDVFYTQIQYSQCVILEFGGLAYPHVSVATLVPADPIPVTIPA